jgi:hypothetical protein
MIEGARKASDQLKHCYETLCMTDLKWVGRAELSCIITSFFTLKFSESL